MLYKKTHDHAALVDMVTLYISPWFNVNFLWRINYALLETLYTISVCFYSHNVLWNLYICTRIPRVFYIGKKCCYVTKRTINNGMQSDALYCVDERNFHKILIISSIRRKRLWFLYERLLIQIVIFLAISKISIKIVRCARK